MTDVIDMFTLATHIFDRYNANIELSSRTRTIRNIAMYFFQEILYRGLMEDESEVSGIPSRSDYYQESVNFIPFIKIID